MLDISPSKVAQVILLAREMEVGEAEFVQFIETLTEEERASLVAVMWIGRGSFEPEELEEAKEQAIREATTPTEDYLAGSPHLADHLENGLESLGINASEAEDDIL